MQNDCQTARLISFDQIEEAIRSLRSRESLEIYMDLMALGIDQDNTSDAFRIKDVVNSLYSEVPRCDMIVCGPILNNEFGHLISLVPLRITFMNYDNYVIDMAEHVEFSKMKHSRLT